MTTYYIQSGEQSGEGEIGTWEAVQMTDAMIKRRLKDERCGGDRWANAYVNAGNPASGDFTGLNIETGDYHAIPKDLIESERDDDGEPCSKCSGSGRIAWTEQRGPNWTDTEYCEDDCDECEEETARRESEARDVA